MAIQQIRQGDVLLVAVSEIPEEVQAVERDAGRVVLAYGEVTGHAHAILEPDAELVEAGEERFLRVLSGANLLHEEHDAIAIPAGTYRVVLQREYTPQAIRQVRD